MTCPAAGNPVVLGTGNKIEPETDFATGGEMPLHLQRTYNLFTDAITLFGYDWISNFDYQLGFGNSSGFSGCYARPSIAQCTTGHTFDDIFAHRPDGRIVQFTKDSATGVYWENKAEPISKIVRQSNGDWLVSFEDNLSELYSQGGYPLWIQDEHGVRWTYTYGGMNNTQVQRVTHTNGRFVQFIWVDDELREVRDPAGTPYTFSYTNQKAYVGFHTLKTTTRPGADPTVITYHYNREPGEPDGPTGLSGKSFNGERYSRFTYDASRRAIGTEHADGVEKNTFAYAVPAAGELNVTHTNPLGKQTVYDFKNGRLLTVTGVASAYCPGSGRDNTYDANGYRNLVTDENGNITDYDYNAKGQLQKKVEAKGTPQARTTTYVWDAGKNRITGVRIAGDSQTDYTFTTDDRLASVTVTNLTGNGVANQTRTTTYTYTKHANGLLASVAVNGPLPTDTVTSTFSQMGDLLTVANGLGHTTTYSNYTALGQPRRVTSPNGAITDFTYDVRGRITSTKAIVNGTTQTTTQAYDGAGLPITVTTPDNVTLTREYDAAHRMVREYQNEAGGTLAVKKYTYNNASQVTSVEVQRTTAVIKPSGTPVVVVGISSPGNYNISWSGSSGLEFYVLQEKINSGNWTQIYSGAGASKSFNSQAAGSYAYRVKACNAEGCTALSAERSVEVAYPPTSAPSVTAPAADPNGAFSVSWSSVSDTTNYRLEQRKNAGSWAQVYTGTARSKAVSGLTDGSYDYRARACNAVGCSSYSGVKSTVVTFPPTGVPAVTAPTADNNGAYSVTWSVVSSATSYQLQQRKDNTAFGDVYNGAATSKSLSGLVNGSYDYRVRACNAGGCAGFSSVRTTLVTFPPTGVSSLTAPATDNNGAYSVTWTAVSGATSYQVQQSKDSGSFVDIYNSSGTSKALSGLTNGTYQYRVRACNVGGCAAFSSTRTTVVTHPPGTPAVTTPTDDNNGAFTVSWSSVATTTQYRLEQSANSGSWTQIYTGTGRSKAVSGFANGSYAYRTRACNAGGCSSYSAVKTTVVTFPPSYAPTLSAPSVVNTYQDYTVSWSAVSTATRYEMQGKLDGGTWTTLSNGGARSMSRTHAHEGDHNYQVRACNVGGCGPFSSIKQVFVVETGGGGGGGGNPPKQPRIVAPPVLMPAGEGM